jgi:enoyl-CoA hydratase/carnithine racemase
VTVATLADIVETTRRRVQEQSRDAGAALVSVDLAPFADVPAEHASGDAYRLLRALLDCPAPTAAYADGPVTGVALAVLLAADLRVASASSSVAAGDPALVPGLAWLLDVRAPAAAAPLLLGLGPMTAAQALAAGILTELAGEEGPAEALASAERALRALPPETVRSRIRSLRAARRSGDFDASARYDGHLRQALSM